MNQQQYKFIKFYDNEITVKYRSQIDMKSTSVNFQCLLT